MRRLTVASIMFAVGYLLVYAAVSEGGKWALNPWGTLAAGG